MLKGSTVQHFKINALRSLETSKNTNQATEFHIPEELIPQLQLCGKTKFHKTPRVSVFWYSTVEPTL
jgi:hypothetical protein